MCIYVYANSLIFFHWPTAFKTHWVFVSCSLKSLPITVLPSALDGVSSFTPVPAYVEPLCDYNYRLLPNSSAFPPSCRSKSCSEMYKFASSCPSLSQLQLSYHFHPIFLHSIHQHPVSFLFYRFSCLFSILPPVECKFFKGKIFCWVHKEPTKEGIPCSHP